MPATAQRYDFPRNGTLYTFYTLYTRDRRTILVVLVEHLSLGESLGESLGGGSGGAMADPVGEETRAINVTTAAGDILPGGCHVRHPCTPPVYMTLVHHP